jgi:hypothetical protein
MFMEFDRSLVRQHNEELLHEARKWHLQRSLRANRQQSLDTRPQVDSSRTGSRTGTGVIETKHERAAHMRLQLSKDRPAWGMKALALSLLGLRRTSHGDTPR